MPLRDISNAIESLEKSSCNLLHLLSWQEASKATSEKLCKTLCKHYKSVQYNQTNKLNKPKLIYTLEIME